jgi:hypothetical protein
LLTTIFSSTYLLSVLCHDIFKPNSCVFFPSSIVTDLFFLNFLGLTCRNDSKLGIVETSLQTTLLDNVGRSMKVAILMPKSENM